MADLAAALGAFYAGDLDRLSSMLSADPSLVHQRVKDRDGHYCGYFFEATLLHHVAGNPTIHPLPANTPALAELFLDRGAAIDASTHQGPSQPDDIGWSVLGLAATSLDARVAGHQRALIELFVRRGADVDFHNGGPLVGALYYGEREAARLLVELGARVDLIVAAGLGRVDLMEPFVLASGGLREDAHTLVHYAQRKPRPRSAPAILSVALVQACMGGHRPAVDWLLAHGASPTARAEFDHDATPLHWAAYHGQREICEVLLSKGADRTLLDSSFQGTPAGWAEHNGHLALARRLAN